MKERSNLAMDNFIMFRTWLTMHPEISDEWREFLRSYGRDVHVDAKSKRVIMKDYTKMCLRC